MPARSHRILWFGIAAVLVAVPAFVMMHDWVGHASQQPTQPDATAGEGDPGQASPNRGDREPGTSREAVTAQAQVPTPQPREHGTLIVQVSREHDAVPVTDVVVTTWPSDGSQRVLSTRVLSTDAAGRAVFDDLVSGPREVKLDRGPVEKLNVVPGEIIEIVFQLPTGLRRHGRVVDERGAPIASARIWIHPAGSLSKPEPGHAVAWSDHEGRFELRGLASSMGIGARAPGYLPAKLHRVRFAWAWVDREIVLRLKRPAALLRGEVVDASGTGVAGAIVCLARLGRRLPDVFLRTDERGRFAANDLHPGRVHLWASAPGLARAQQQVDLQPGIDKQIRLELGERAILTGHVLDGERAPVAAATVDILGRRVRTDANGAYRFADLASGVVRLQVHAPGFAPLSREVELTAGTETRRDLVLLARPRLSGRVLSTTGEGLLGWIVEAQSDDATGQNHFRATSTQGGLFAIGVEPDRTYRLRLREPGHRLAWDCDHLGSLTPGSAPVDLVVPDAQRATAYVRFVVVDAKNRPQRLWFQLSDGKRLVTPGRGMPSPKFDEATGELLVGPVPPRAYRLRIHAVDNSFPIFKTNEFRLSPGQQLSLGRIRIPAHGWVDYNMSNREHIDFAAVKLQVTSKDESRDSAIYRVENGGRGRLPLLPGRYEIVVYGGKLVHLTRSMVVRPGKSTPLDIQRRLGVRVHLEAKLPDGEETLDCILRAADGTVCLRWLIRRNGPWGLALSPRLPPGPMSVEATGARGSYDIKGFEVKGQDDRQRAQLDFRGSRR